MGKAIPKSFLMIMMKKLLAPFRYLVINYGYTAYALIIVTISILTIVESVYLINRIRTVFSVLIINLVPFFQKIFSYEHRHFFKI